MARAWQLTFDCADPAALSAFWAETLGYVLQPPPDGYDDGPSFLEAMDVPVEDHDSASAIVDPAGSGHRIYFQRVPEEKSVKNSLHADVPVSGGPQVPLERRVPLQDEERDRLVALGASQVGPVHEQGSHWIVMQDPEGNELCIT